MMLPGYPTDLFLNHQLGPRGRDGPARGSADKAEQLVALRELELQTEHGLLEPACKVRR